MDETTKAIVERISIRSATPIRLPNGESTGLFYDTAQLTPNDLARLAAEAVGHLGEGAFDAAVGIAYRGILFAAAIAGGRPVVIYRADGELCGTDLRGRRAIVVGDVVRNGNELLRAERCVAAAGGCVIGYACIVDRSQGKFGNADKPLWSAFESEG